MDNDMFELELHVQIKEKDDFEDDQEYGFLSYLFFRSKK